MREICSRFGSRISCDANALYASLICAALVGRRVFLCWCACVVAIAAFKRFAPRHAIAPEFAATAVDVVPAPPREHAFHPPRGIAVPPPPDVSPLIGAMRRAIAGNSGTAEALAVALLAQGHALLEGAPGLAKTLTCRAMAAACGGSFARVQCNADLTPAEITGCEVFDQRDLSFRVRLGPVCANFVLADEINRAPARAQAAFLEAMEEQQLTVGGMTHPLPKPFMLLATMNEAEPDGIFALPRAQLDRFALKIVVGFPEAADELALLDRDERRPSVTPVADAATIISWQTAVRAIYCAPMLKERIVAIVRATREAAANGVLDYGAGPRASIALLQSARARAALASRSYVLPGDVDASVRDVLRHRVAFPREYLWDRSERERHLSELLEAEGFACA